MVQFCENIDGKKSTLGIMQCKGRPPTEKNYYFRALPESGGGALPENFRPFFTKY